MKILVTGGSGYLGAAAVAALQVRGHKIVTIGRHPGTDSIVCDLNDRDAVYDAVRAVGDIDTVVHLAARAHDFRGLTLDDLLLANTTTTDNLVAALRAAGRTATVRFVYASSVAVYELLQATRRLTAEQAPYAASKLQAEQSLHSEPFQSLSVLRFAPIYDPNNLHDVAKRVYLPGTRLKLRLCPPPVHSLCTLERAVQTIVDAVETSAMTGRHIANVTDPLPISQQDLLDWFPGRSLPVPTALFHVAASIVGLCGATGRKASRLISKFVGSTRYPRSGGCSQGLKIALHLFGVLDVDGCLPTVGPHAPVVFGIDTAQPHRRCIEAADVQQYAVHAVIDQFGGPARLGYRDRDSKVQSLLDHQAPGFTVAWQDEEVVLSEECGHAVVCLVAEVADIAVLKAAVPAGDGQVEPVGSQSSEQRQQESDVLLWCEG